MNHFLLQIWDIWMYGGSVMPFLIATAFVLWYALGLRILALRRGDRRALRTMLADFSVKPPARERGLVQAAAARGAKLWKERGGPVPEPHLDQAFDDLFAALGTGRRLVGSLVAMAPLLGLLGTVTGLIETFGSLGASSTSTASEGIAGGIVEALYATQMGLAIAVPGLLVGGILHHREQKLTQELFGLKELLRGAWRGAAA